MDQSTDLDRKRAIDDLTRRMRNHVCEGFAILEAFDRLRETPVPSELPTFGDAEVSASRRVTKHGWIAAGY